MIEEEIAPSPAFPATPIHSEFQKPRRTMVAGLISNSAPPAGVRRLEVEVELDQEEADAPPMTTRSPEAVEEPDQRGDQEDAVAALCGS